MPQTSLQDRQSILALADAGQTDAQIAQQLGWPRATVRKWRRRGQTGRDQLASRYGRPARGALSAFPSEVLDTLRTWRTTHPGWGPKTLRAELEQLAWLRGRAIPACASIARWLKAEGLNQRYERHRALPQPAPRSPLAPHDEWEMDARGHAYVPDVGVIALIDVNDVASKVKLCSYPCWLGQRRATRYASIEDYQQVLRLTFSEWGLPERLAVDRATAFHDVRSKSPFPTRFHLWLLALGVQLTFGRPHCPTDQAMTERSHQTWARQVLQGQTFDEWHTLARALRQRRDFLNHHLPCATLGDRPPLVAYPQACVPRQPYRPEWEAEVLDVTRVYAYLAQGHWFRRANPIGGVNVGSHVYYLGPEWARQEVEVTFDAAEQQLIFVSAATRTARRPIQGVTVTDLLGALSPLVQRLPFQLALPFSWADWQAIQLCHIMP